MLNTIFWKMEQIGWNLEDFEEILENHEQVFELIACGIEVDKDAIKYASEFMCDFIKAIKEIDAIQKGGE